MRSASRFMNAVSIEFDSLARIAAHLAGAERPTLVTNPAALMATGNSAMSVDLGQHDRRRFALLGLFLPPELALSSDQHLRNLVHALLQRPGDAPGHRETFLIGFE